MNILFYTPFNSRSRDTESLMQEFVAQGHIVFLLTQAEAGTYHEHCKKYGVRTYSYVIPKRAFSFYFIRHSFYLKSFCAQHKIDVVYAHIENAALPAVLAQFFIRARVYACRHIIDEAYLMKNRKFILLNKIVYSLAKHIIVVSEHCRQFMISKEKISASKIQVILLAYNFDLYSAPDNALALKIRNEHSAEILLLTACRMMPAKRPDISIMLVKNLRQAGINAQLILLGTGPMTAELKTLIKKEKLEPFISMPGYVKNVPDYLQACDLLAHPSLQDSSSVIVKEAGLVKKPVMLCAGIGDADEYLVDGTNAFIVSPENTLSGMEETIKRNLADRQKLENIGRNLHDVVVKRFNINGIIAEYNKIHAEILNEKN